MTPIAGVPSRSEVTASCRLHDEQLPQSPIPAKVSAHDAASFMISVSAGAE
jgi:hypothetical protein